MRLGNTATPARLALILLMGALFYIDSLTPLGVVDWFLYIIPLLLAARHRRRGLHPYLVGAICTPLVIIGWITSPPGIDRGLALLNRAMGIGVLWLVASVLVQRQRVEETLQTTNETLQALIHASPLAITALDLDGKVKLWNPAAERIFGWPESEVLGRPLPFVPLEKQDEFRSLRHQLGRGQTLTGVELRRQRRDGSHIDITLWAGPLHDPRGEVTGIIGVVADSTERKRTEEQLRLQGTALTSAANAVVITDREGRITWVNPAFTRLTGYSLEEVVGQTPRLLKSGKHDAAFYQELWQTILSGQMWRREIINCRKDGSLYTEEQSITPVWDDRGQISHFVAIHHDITERKRTEEALRRYADRLTSLHNIDQAILAAQSSEAIAQAALRHIWQLVPCLTASVALFDFSAREAVLLAAHANSGGMIGQGTRLRLEEFGAVAALREGRVEVVEDIRLLADLPPLDLALQAEGTHSYVRLPLMAQGDLIGALTLGADAPGGFALEQLEIAREVADQLAIAIRQARLHDQVQHHAAELEGRVAERTAELKAANRQLQEVSRHKSEFLANMSHELRTPLNSIIGFSELLRGQGVGPLTDKQARYLGHIHSSGKHLLQLIGDILDISKVEAGKFVLQPEDLPVLQTLEDILVIARGLASEKFQEIRTEIEPDLPPLHADPVRFKQILFNLFSNAVKFTPNGGTITLRARKSEGRGKEAGEVRPLASLVPSLVIDVRDTGVGIDPEDMPKLFQEFVQLDATGAKRHEGTGLGLALTKRLVELHGGRIWAESPGEGRGTTFTILLPFGGPTTAGNSPASPQGTTPLH